MENINTVKTGLDEETMARIKEQADRSKFYDECIDEINAMQKEMKLKRLKNVRTWYELEYKDILNGKKTFDDIPASRKEAYDEFPEVIQTITSILDTHYKASKRKEEYISI